MNDILKNDRIKHITPQGDPPIPPWKVWRVFAAIWQHRHLTWEYGRREILYRYKESYLGLIWSLLTPLLFLVLYSFTFSILFGASWQPPRMQAMQNAAEMAGGGAKAFAMVLFPGLLAFNFFAETLGVSVGAFIGNPQYVRKMVFPLEVLPLGQCLSVFFNLLLGLFVFLLGLIFFWGGVPWTFPLIIFILIPLALLCAGLAFWIASLAVFIRDVGQFVAVFSMAMLFLSPVFYGMERVTGIIRDYFPGAPDWIGNLYRINPMTTLLENIRLVAVFRSPPEWGWLSVTTLFCLAVFLTGFNFFQRSKKAFADVL